MAQKRLLLLELYRKYPKRPSEILFEHAELDSYTKDVIDLSYMSHLPGKSSVFEDIMDIINGKKTTSGIPIDLPPEPDIDPKYFKGAKWAHPSWK